MKPPREAPGLRRERQPALKAYKEHCEAQPTFSKALADQLAAFERSRVLGRPGGSIGPGELGPVSGESREHSADDWKRIGVAGNVAFGVSAGQFGVSQLAQL